MQVDEVVAEPFTVADSRLETGIFRPADPEARPPPLRRHEPQGRDDAGVDPDARESCMQRRELGPLVCGSIEMLKPTTAACLEMAAARRCPPRPGGEPVDDQAFPSAIAASS